MKLTILIHLKNVLCMNVYRHSHARPCVSVCVCEGGGYIKCLS